MTPKKPRRQRLLDALDYVHAHRRLGTAPIDIIDGLVARHDGSRGSQTSTHTLRVAGTTASCTWSRDGGLLDAWVQLANRHLAVLDGRATPDRERVA